MQLLVIQHDHASPLGPVAERFVERGFDLTMHPVVPESSFLAPGVETEFPDFTRFDAVVPMGAPWSAYDEVIGSWVRPEIEQLRRADEAGVPVLGICFGGQLLAATHGGAVIASSTPEIGWADVRSDDDVAGARRAVVPVALRPVGAPGRRPRGRAERLLVASLRAPPQPRRAVPPRAHQHHARRLAGQRRGGQGARQSDSTRTPCSPPPAPPRPRPGCGPTAWSTASSTTWPRSRSAAPPSAEPEPQRSIHTTRGAP